MHDDELNTWGLEFVQVIDKEAEQEDDVMKLAWMEGNLDACLHWIQENHPDITEEQIERLDQFLSEI